MGIKFFLALVDKENVILLAFSILAASWARHKIVYDYVVLLCGTGNNCCRSICFNETAIMDVCANATPSNSKSQGKVTDRRGSGFYEK